MEKLWLRVDSVDAPAKAVDGGIGWYLSIAKGDLSNSYTNSGGAEIYIMLSARLEVLFYEDYQQIINEVMNEKMKESNS